MFVDQSYYYWKFTYELVVVHDFQVLHIDTEGQEVWLEKERNWKTEVIRLRQTQMNWSNELKRDLLMLQQQIKKNRQVFQGGKVTVHNVYVSEFPPVDDWQRTLDELPEEKSTIHVYYMADETKADERKRLYNAFDLNEPEFEQDPSSEEKEAMIPYLQQQIMTRERQRRKEAESVFQFGKPRITYLLLALNIFIFLYIEMRADTTNVETLIQYGAKYNPAILDGEWWRIVSSMFLHIGTLHIIMNMLALFYLGTAVERIYGTWRFTFIYFLAGVFGGLASFMLNPSVAAGASGAIFGLFGALLFFGVQNRQLFFRTMGWNLLFVIGLNIAFGLLVPQVDNGAHVGGLIGGFLASALVNLPKRKNAGVQSIALVLYSVFLGAMVYLGMNSTFNDGQSFAQIQETQQLNQEGEFEQVISMTSDSIEEGGDFEAPLRFNRSYAYIQLGEIAQAKEDLLRVVELSPDMAEAHYNLAILYRQEGELDKAADHAGTAAELNPENEDFTRLEEELSS
ncbi:rhomboid family intramembrane serine protease [Halobacillus litoralis]|uniref:rhomboid family intramembrane serine protease n=1 Tax=Halobacillus litoralis TaxID=45668 RepID=UPI001CD39ACE|nr:rhomboid family intramembrane serine protease [Halobacillus litoralis]MCA0970082.1 rhomboid family intramembrane serine protease [Halobacillus litoralis]